MGAHGRHEVRSPTPAEIRSVLESEGRGPRRRLGQHFLCDDRLLATVVREAGVVAGDVVLEVGPGPGGLTLHLLAAGARVVAVEVDPTMAAALRRLLGEPGDLDLVLGDALRRRRLAPEMTAALDRALAERGTKNYRLCANLPYGVASPLLISLFEERAPVRSAVTLQWEVARRLVARPGEKAYGALSVLLGARVRARIVRRVPAGAFWPPPKVDSAIVRLDPAAAAGPEPSAPPALFSWTVRVCFQARRKRLDNALRLAARGHTPHALEWARGVLEEAGLEGDRRAETLAVAEFCRLAAAVGRRLGPGSFDPGDGVA